MTSHWLDWGTKGRSKCKSEKLVFSNLADWDFLHGKRIFKAIKFQVLTSTASETTDCWNYFIGDIKSKQKSTVQDNQRSSWNLQSHSFHLKFELASVHYSFTLISWLLLLYLMRQSFIFTFTLTFHHPLLFLFFFFPSTFSLSLSWIVII